MKELARYRRIAEDVAKLEKEELALWRLSHGDSVLDTGQLYSEVGARAQSELATEEDTAHLRLLKELRDNRAILLNVKDRVSRQTLQSRVLPSASFPVQVRITAITPFRDLS